MESKSNTNISASQRKLPYYSREEVAEHNVPNDCWVSFFGKVYDLTPLIEKHRGLLVQPILKFAGQDISHWFNPKTKEPKTWVDPDTNTVMPFVPFGRYVHIPPKEPVSTWDTDFGTPWWADPQYLVGNLSTRRRRIHVVNQLTGQDDIIDVCAEETLEEIRERYTKYNAHAKGYTWRRLGKPLDMSKTLEENGIPDESAELESLAVDSDEFVPAIHIYFNDDLTIA